MSIIVIVKCYCEMRNDMYDWLDGIYFFNFTSGTDYNITIKIFYGSV